MISLLFPEYDQFTLVTSAPGISYAPKDYMDFWCSLQAFGRSLKNSTLVEINKVYFRKRGEHLYLCTYDTTGEQLLKTLSQLKAAGCKLKTWAFAHKDFKGVPVRKGYLEWHVGPNFSIEYVMSKKASSRANKVWNKYKHGKENYTVIPQCNFSNYDVMKLFNRWRMFAQPRHFMVTIGHYLEYIKLAYTQNSGVQLLGFRNSTGVLFGVAGWEIAPNGSAQFTFMKHLPGDNNFSTYFWVRAIEEVLKCNKVKKVFCGSTADDLKLRLGMTCELAYKINIDAI